jgi:hypothetical protein
MPVRPLTPSSGRLDVGDTWLIGLEVRDLDDELADTAVAVTVTRPDTTTATPAAVRESTGIYTATYELLAPGRHTAKVVCSGTVVSVTGFAVDAAVIAARPTLAQVKEYLRDAAKGWSDAEIQFALDAETVNQAGRCRIPAAYPADLAEALKRRVRRNLAMRGLSLGVQTSEAGPIRIGGLDQEIRRYEAGYRKLTVG